MPPPVPVLAVEPIVEAATHAAPSALEYARVSTAGLDPAAHAALRAYATQAVWLAVLSGLCVGVCFLTLSGAGDSVVRNVIHLCVFLTTLGLGVTSGIHLRRSGVLAAGPAGRLGWLTLLDGVACVGLLALAVAPFVYLYSGRANAGDYDYDSTATLLAIAFWCFATTTYRHRLLYRGLADLSRNLFGHGSSFGPLGMTKTIYECLWLTCCAAALTLSATDYSSDATILFAYAAFFGCFGFGVIWVWMIITHTSFRGRVGRG